MQWFFSLSNERILLPKIWAQLSAHRQIKLKMWNVKGQFLANTISIQYDSIQIFDSLIFGYLFVDEISTMVDKRKVACIKLWKLCHSSFEFHLYASDCSLISEKNTERNCFVQKVKSDFRQFHHFWSCFRSLFSVWSRESNYESMYDVEASSTMFNACDFIGKTKDTEQQQQHLKSNWKIPHC